MIETRPYIKYRYEVIQDTRDNIAAAVRVTIDDRCRETLKIFKGKFALRKAEATAQAYRMEQERAVNRGIVAEGKCPDCGAALKQNLALTGWHQCEQFGAVGFRKDGSKPSCSFQCFI